MFSHESDLLCWQGESGNWLVAHPWVYFITQGRTKNEATRRFLEGFALIALHQLDRKGVAKFSLTPDPILSEWKRKAAGLPDFCCEQGHQSETECDAFGDLAPSEATNEASFDVGERRSVLLWLQRSIEWYQEPGRFMEHERDFAVGALRCVMREIQSGDHWLSTRAQQPQEAVTEDPALVGQRKSDP